MAAQGEVDEFFADIANEDKEDLMDELEEMAALDELDDIGAPAVGEIASNKVPSGPASVPA